MFVIQDLTPLYSLYILQGFSHTGLQSYLYIEMESRYKEAFVNSGLDCLNFLIINLFWTFSSLKL